MTVEQVIKNNELKMAKQLNQFGYFWQEGDEKNAIVGRVINVSPENGTYQAYIDKGKDGDYEEWFDFYSPNKPPTPHKYVVIEDRYLVL